VIDGDEGQRESSGKSPTATGDCKPGGACSSDRLPSQASPQHQQTTYPTMIRKAKNGITTGVPVLRRDAVETLFSPAVRLFGNRSGCRTGGGQRNRRNRVAPVSPHPGPGRTALQNPASQSSPSAPQMAAILERLVRIEHRCRLDARRTAGTGISTAARPSPMRSMMRDLGVVYLPAACTTRQSRPRRKHR